jgi:tetratricopeptide (TPR) repeat protein
MKKFLCLIAVCMLFNNIQAQEDSIIEHQTAYCTDKNLEPEFSNDVRVILEKNKQDAFYAYAKNPKDADALIWLGRRMGYMGQYREAIELFSNGIKTIGMDPRFYRHRGHRYLTIRCFDKAIDDFTIAVSLVEGKPDEVEPDGIPNEMNIPTSTLQTNIWYHLGLAYYLKEDWKKSADAFKECLDLSKNNDMYVASAYWLNMAYRRSGQKSAAESLIKSIAADLELIENLDYYKIILIYKGIVDANELYKNLIDSQKNTISISSAGYGLSMFYYFKNEKAKSLELKNRILRSNQVSSFGYIATEKEKY